MDPGNAGPTACRGANGRWMFDVFWGWLILQFCCAGILFYVEDFAGVSGVSKGWSGWWQERGRCRSGGQVGEDGEGLDGEVPEQGGAEREEEGLFPEEEEGQQGDGGDQG